VDSSKPLVLYAEVKLCGTPVMKARVVARLRVIGLAGGGLSRRYVDVELLDNGSGGKIKDARNPSRISTFSSCNATVALAAKTIFRLPKLAVGAVTSLFSLFSFKSPFGCCVSSGAGP
jgi:hypothetical protein